MLFIYYYLSKYTILFILIVNYLYLLLVVFISMYFIYFIIYLNIQSQELGGCGDKRERRGS